MTKLFRPVVTLTAIYDRVLIASFYFRETIHATTLSDERFLWKEEKSYTSINAVNNELSKKDLPHATATFTTKLKMPLLPFSETIRKKYVKGEQVVLLNHGHSEVKGMK